MGKVMEKVYRPEPFFIEFAKTYLHGDILKKDCDTQSSPTILFLHGMSQSADRNSFHLLRQSLLHHYDVSSCAFDYVGHGGTGGEWEGDSLQRRTEQTLDVIDACFDCQALTIVAVGVSAYVALKLLSLAPVENLILIRPLVPFPELYKLSFRNLLAEQALCLPRSLESTDIFEPLQSFEGGMGLVVAEQDERVPQSLVKQWRQGAVFTREQCCLTIPGRSFALQALVHTQPLLLMEIARMIARLCAVSNELVAVDA